MPAARKHGRKECGLHEGLKRAKSTPPPHVRVLETKESGTMTSEERAILRLVTVAVRA
jgi:hypothetical protein